MSDTRYDPFEDTGDWPFRDAPPPPDEDEQKEPTAPPFAAGDTAVASSPFPEGLQEALAPYTLGSDAVASPPAEAPHVERSIEGEPEAPEEPPAEGAVDLEPSAEAVAAVAELVELGEVVDEPDGALEAAEPPASEASVVTEETEAEEQPAEAGEEPAEAGEEPAEAEEHAPGAFAVPAGPDVIEGGPHGFRRNVAIVVSRFNGDVTSRLLEVAVAELRECHVTDDAITVVPVPGAFELPLAALALAKTRRYSCIVALGCVIRGETAHFDLVAGEAASGLQLAAIETGIPVSFGVVTCDTREQAEARVDRAADAARTALEMADLFSHVRTRAAG